MFDAQNSTIYSKNCRIVDRNIELIKDVLCAHLCLLCVLVPVEARRVPGACELLTWELETELRSFVRTACANCCAVSPGPES